MGSNILSSYLAHFLSSALKKFSLKKFLIFFPKKNCSENLSYIYSEKPPKFSGNGTFLCFKKGLFRTLTYSERWYIQNPRHIQDTVKRLRWKVLQKIPSAFFSLSPQNFSLKKNPKKPALKKFLIFSQKKPFLIFSQKAPRTFWPKLEKIDTVKNSLYFRKWNFLAVTLKEFQQSKTPKKFNYISGNENPEKISYIFLKESFSYILETSKKLFIFQETKLFYISGKVYSEP